jgi:DNA modification methylase
MGIDILVGDSLHLPFSTGYFHTVVTSPPYWGLRDYGLGKDSLGLEPTPELYVQHLVDIFREVGRTLRDDGTLWLNIGDSYASQGGSRTEGSHDNGVGRGPAVGGVRIPTPGLKPKDLVGIPWMLAFALRADGWYLRSDIIWHKPNVMPESVKDRPTKAHEYLFLLSKSKRYYYDADAIREPTVGTNLHDLTGPSYKAPGQTRQTGSRNPVSHKGSYFNRGKTATHQLGRSSAAPRQDNPAGRNRRSVWNIATQPYPGAHFAVFPEKLVEPCILAGSPKGGLVLDPFAGSGTVGVVAKQLGRNAVLVDAKPEYTELARQRIS